MNRTLPLILTAALLLTACASATDAAPLTGTTRRRHNLPLRRSVLPGTT